MLVFIALLHPTACKLLLVNTLALPCSHCFSHVFFNLTHIFNILDLNVIKSHQMVLLEMVFLILFTLAYLRAVPSEEMFMAKCDTSTVSVVKRLKSKIYFV